MCNLYAMTTNQQAIREIAGVMSRPDRQPAAFSRDLSRLLRPDHPKPPGRARIDAGALGNALASLCAEGPEFRSGRHQCPQCRLAALATLPLGADNRCIVPFTSFSENETLPDGSKPPVWFALDETRPLAFFAGIWTRWTSVRKVKEGETTNDIFAFLTTEPNQLVGAIHPKAMPAILTTREEIDLWMTAPTAGGAKASAASCRRLPQDHRRGP